MPNEKHIFLNEPIPSAVALYKVIAYGEEIWRELDEKRANYQNDLKFACAHNFFQKTLMAAHSILDIIRPITQEEVSLKSPYNDFISAMVITRSIFETYVNMNYLFNPNLGDEEKCFRLLIYEKNSFNQLLNFKKVEIKGKEDVSEDEKKETEDTKNEVDNFIMKIKKTNYYKKLGKSQKKLAVNPEKWSIHSRKERENLTDFNESQRIYLYGLFSAYSHAEPYGITMISMMRNQDEIYSQIYLPLLYTEMCLTFTIQLYCNVFGLKLRDDIEKRIGKLNGFKSQYVWQLKGSKID
ncbi:MAG: hypothetical protein A3F80_01060 [Candidatus Melainabacteria bacterium RIFCSPLOWO2_12_FULL_35_11]|nr:MAG: hypothetical protein A3F80_01060 [Candidatus Melainabacteria bacterium RIFCSPLOWO2_12_FULL_35_11]